MKKLKELLDDAIAALEKLQDADENGYHSPLDRTLTDTLYILYEIYDGDASYLRSED